MPRTFRKEAIRHLQYAVRDTDRAQAQVVIAGGEYEVNYPELYQHFVAITSALELIKESITALDAKL